MKFTTVPYESSGENSQCTSQTTGNVACVTHLCWETSSWGSAFNNHASPPRLQLIQMPVSAGTDRTCRHALSIYNVIPIFTLITMIQSLRYWGNTTPIAVRALSAYSLSEGIFIIYSHFSFMPIWHRGGVMIAGPGPGPVEPRQGTGRGRRRTSCEACRLVKKRCEGGTPCDRYGALVHCVDVATQKSS
jgi:hypothetical protein